MEGEKHRNTYNVAPMHYLKSVIEYVSTTCHSTVVTLKQTTKMEKKSQTIVKKNNKKKLRNV